MRGYNGIKMQVWEERLKQLFKEASDYAYDWLECQEMVEKAPQDKTLLGYMELLVPRLKRMDRTFNRVTHVIPKDNTPKYWEIANYTYNMYSYWKKKYPADIVITPYTIHIADEKLNVADREQLQKQL